jgi:hypothetical protein
VSQPQVTDNGYGLAYNHIISQIMNYAVMLYHVFHKRSKIVPSEYGLLHTEVSSGVFGSNKEQ